MTAPDSTPAFFDQLNTIEDVERLIASGQRESETLEYKAAAKLFGDADYAELAKDVSAFANSLGGVLIYGIATDRSDKTRPKQVEPINPENIERILRVIATYVRHPIPGIRHKAIPSDGTAQLFLLEVPASPLAPHQVAVKDHRYYRRNGAVSDPMAHDLVEMYFGRRLSPVLTPISGPLTRTSEWPNGAIGQWAARIGARNDGQSTAPDVEMFAYVPASPLFTIGVTSSFTHAWSQGAGTVYRYAGQSIRLHPERGEWMMYFHISPKERAVDNPSCPMAHVDLYAQGAKRVQATFYLVNGPKGSGRLVLEPRPTNSSAEYPAWPLES